MKDINNVIDVDKKINENKRNFVKKRSNSI